MITVSVTIPKIGELNYSNLRSIESTIIDRKDIELPSWGVVSNSGRIKFIDNEGNVLKLSESGDLEKALCTIYINNTLNNYKEQVGQYYTSSWDYDNDTKEATVVIKDLLEKMQSIDLRQQDFRYNIFVNTNISAEEIYNLLRSITVTKMNKPYYLGFKMKAFEDLDNITKNHLQRIQVKYFYIEPANLWSYWNKFCNLTQTHIYTDKNGEATCKYNGGN